MKVDVIIPLYKPDKRLFALLDILERQTIPVDQIILMNTEEKYFEQLVYGTDFAHRYGNVRVFHVSKREFDHGATRRLGVSKSRADVFVMMTQDAVVQSEKLLENLLAPLGGKTAVAYARQLAGKRSSVLEQFARQFNYPAKSMVKSRKDLKELGIKTYFCSDVCAAYRRDIYDRLGGFVKKAIFNEDMLYAAKAVNAGYSVAYQAEAEVIHSHNYTCMQQLRRNFDLGVSQADHPEVFGAVRSESEGMRLVKSATGYLRQNHMTCKIPYFYLQCAFKYAGYLLGKHYRILPGRVILFCTSNRDYWGKTV